MNKRSKRRTQNRSSYEQAKDCPPLVESVDERGAALRDGPKSSGLLSANGQNLDEVSLVPFALRSRPLLAASRRACTRGNRQPLASGDYRAVRVHRASSRHARLVRPTCEQGC